MTDHWKLGGTYPPPPKPATRIGRTVIFQGGAVRRLSLLAWALCACGLKRTVKTP